MAEKVCHYCGSSEHELRPYGPGGSYVCLDCATATPEREKQTDDAYIALLAANAALSPTGVAAIGQEDGPVPFDPDAMSEPDA